MRIALIVAAAQNRVIGRDGDLPWRLPSDLKRFKRLTLDHPLVMGRKTYASIGRPLPRRRMVVLSRQPDYAPDGVEVVSSLEAALALLEGAAQIFIGGGAAVYAAALEIATDVHLSLVHARVAGDVCFPRFDPADWTVVDRSEHPADARHDHAHTWLHLRRRRTGDPAAPPLFDA